MIAIDECSSCCRVWLDAKELTKIRDIAHNDRSGFALGMLTDVGLD